MMSVLALTGFAFGGFGGAGVSDADDLADDEPYAQAYDETDTLNLSLDLLVSDDPADADPETLDFDRGDLVTGFNPQTDVLELEYSAALGAPEITVTDFTDGTGASVALNGVVVADVEGAQGLTPENVALKAV
jgi:hypothetical protein